MFSAQFLAESALTALRDSHRDATRVELAARDHAMRLVLSTGYSQTAMDLAHQAALVCDALAERIAVLEPEIGKLVAANLQATDEQHAQPLH